MRVGSTNRIADAVMIAEIKRSKEHASFDQLPELRISSDQLDLDLIRKLFAGVNKTYTKAAARSLELIVDYHDTPHPVINAILHAHYSTMRSSVQVAIFDDHMEITNPGLLPLGLSLETALSRVSQLRNRVIGRVFRELNLIEQWGSGLARMHQVCLQHGGSPPKFKELDLFFRVTLYPQAVKRTPQQSWYQPIFEHIQKYGKISALEADKIWKVTRKTANQRLKQLCKEGLLVEISEGTFDPYKVFILAEPGKQPK